MMAEPPLCRTTRRRPWGAAKGASTSGASRSWLRVDRLDDVRSLVADAGQNADRPQQACRVVDEEEERRQAGDGQQGRDERDDLEHRLVETVERHDGEDEREHEQPDAVADDVVAQQRGRDDARRQLAAGDLDRDQQRSEREHHERQRQRDRRLVERLRAGQRQSRQPPSQPHVQDAQRRREDEHQQNREQRDGPERRAQVARGADRSCSTRTSARCAAQFVSGTASIFRAAPDRVTGELRRPLGISVMEWN